MSLDKYCAFYFRYSLCSKGTSTLTVSWILCYLLDIRYNIQLFIMLHRILYRAMLYSTHISISFFRFVGGSLHSLISYSISGTLLHLLSFLILLYLLISLSHCWLTVWLKFILWLYILVKTNNYIFNSRIESWIWYSNEIEILISTSSVVLYSN